MKGKFAPVSGVEGRAWHDLFLSFAVIKINHRQECLCYYMRNSAPIFLPRSAEAAARVHARNSIAQTPKVQAI